ncbi:MAG: ABC transporter permease [Rectinemataceae bacterium]
MSASAAADIVVIARRDLSRNLRQRNQWLGAVARPAVWLLILGAGLGTGRSADFISGYSYRQFTFPGIVVMGILFSGIMSGASIVWDREFGFLKEIRIAPVARTSILVGKLLAGTLLSLLQGIAAFLFFPFIGIGMTPLKIFLSLLCMAITGTLATSIGILLAGFVKTIEGFGNVNNLLAMPLFALSGAVYPLSGAPEWLKRVAYFDPFTYAVNLMRNAVLDVGAYPIADIAGLLLLTFMFLAAAYLRLDL